MQALVWFRADLRTADNPALHHACAEAGRGVMAVFVVCPDQWKEHDWAAIRVDFILRTLEELKRELHKLKIPLVVSDVPTFDEVPEHLLDLARRRNCDALFFNREYEVNEARRDRAVTDLFTREGLEVRAFTDQVILPPGSLQTGQGDFYTVFTPFKNAWIKRVKETGLDTPLRRPKARPAFAGKSDDVPESISGFDAGDDHADRWPAGEREAMKRLRAFVRHSIDDYAKTRDLPAAAGTSALSPYLAVGAVSARQCLDAAADSNNGKLDGGRQGPSTWISELIWREFYRHILVGYPRVCMHRPFRLETEKLKWRDADDDFEAWCEGRTGFPIVDAGMRQLAATGWMHNRLRMIVAMFLTKDLFIDWRRGEQHFMRHLIDGDLASNNGGWQWSASTGTDAAPYFRIFNPASQSRKCDPDGAFIRQWVPELADLDDKAIHEPHAKPGLFDGELEYPEPIVDHAKARDRAIAAFKKLS